MYILADIEWINEKNNPECPVQLAAVRTDEHWNITDSFSALIRPFSPADVECWWQVGFGKHKKEDILRAPHPVQALESFLTWLEEDDVICWWYPQSVDFFDRACGRILGRAVPNRSIALRDYTHQSSALSEGSMRDPYAILKQLSLPVPGRKHCSVNDVAAVWEIMSTVAFPQDMLALPPVPKEKKHIVPEGVPYIEDRTHKIMHIAECTEYSPADELIGCTTLKKLFKRKNELKACSCCKKAFLAERRRRNEKTVAESRWNFVSAKGSNVFHHYSCRLILGAVEISGTEYYRTCMRNGWRPCEVCCPSERSPLKNVVQRAVKAPLALTPPKSRQEVFTRTPTKEELRAYGRLKMVQQAKRNADLSSMTPQQLRDFNTLNQLRYGFIASRGYANYHLHGCQKLNGLTGLVGFAFDREARRAGYTPCRLCRPSSKHDVNVYFTPTSKRRSGESLDDVKRICDENGYLHARFGAYYSVETPAGKWLIDIKDTPITLMHINLIKTPNNQSYHRQPRIFLSITDAVMYIKRHDENLLCCSEMACSNG